MIDNIETNLDRTSVYLKDIEPQPGTLVTDAMGSPFLIDVDVVPLKNPPLSNQ